MIELFEDIAPLAAAHFRHRCSEGATDTYKGTAIHKVIHQLGGFGGRSPKYNAGVHVRRYASLRHVDKGVVSISATGAEFLLAVSRVLNMDATFQVRPLPVSFQVRPLPPPSLPPGEEAALHMCACVCARACVCSQVG